MDRKEWSRKIDEAYCSIKKPLIMAFTEFYGIEYSEKITNVINNLTIMKMCLNYSKEELIRKKNKILNRLNQLVKKIARSMNLQCDDIDSIVIASRLESCSKEEIKRLCRVYPKLDKDIINDVIRLKVQYEYYSLALNEKINETDSSIFLGINDENLTDVDKSKLNRQVQNGNRNSVLEAYHFLYVPVIAIKLPGINIHAIIHEINHLLRKKVALNLPINDDLDVHDKWYGVNSYSSTKDLFYEIVNDIMATNIFEVFKKYYKEDNYIIENKICDSYYLFLDSITKGVVSGIYNNNKEIIKSIFIESGGDEFIDIINLKNYSDINEILVRVYCDTSKMFENCVPVRVICENGVSGQDLDNLNIVSQIIDEKLSRYKHGHHR